VREDREASGRWVAGIDFDEHRRPEGPRAVLACLCKKEHPYPDTLYGNGLGGIVRLGEVDASFGREVGEINALCER
jgi:hypothetical protein